MILQLEMSDEQLSKIAEMVAVKIRAGKAGAYSIKEVAEMMGVNVSTIQRRVNAKLYPTVPNLNPIRIPAAFIDKLVNPNPDA